MTSTPLSRIDTTLLYPPFFERIAAMLSSLGLGGVSYFAVAGFRTYAEQGTLYAQGRAVPGTIVTKARAGESPHNFGIAVDFTRDRYIDRAGLQPDFEPEAYFELGQAAHAQGLVWGGLWQWPDRPHVQWPGYVTATELAPVREAYEAHGLQAAFGYLDLHSPVTPTKEA